MGLQMGLQRRLQRYTDSKSGSRAGVVGIYQRHDFLDEKRMALAAWQDHVARLIKN